VLQTKLASSLVNFRAHYKIVWLYFFMMTMMLTIVFGWCGYSNWALTTTQCVAVVAMTSCRLRITTRTTAPTSAPCCSISSDFRRSRSFSYPFKVASLCSLGHSNSCSVCKRLCLVINMKRLLFLTCTLPLTGLLRSHHCISNACFSYETFSVFCSLLFTSIQNMRLR